MTVATRGFFKELGIHLKDVFLDKWRDAVAGTWVVSGVAALCYLGCLFPAVSIAAFRVVMYLFCAVLGAAGLYGVFRSLAIIGRDVQI